MRPQLVNASVAIGASQGTSPSVAPVALAARTKAMSATNEDGAVARSAAMATRERAVDEIRRRRTPNSTPGSQMQLLARPLRERGRKAAAAASRVRSASIARHGRGPR
jgi:hypothetical protein